jgi:hypothetical protein
MDTIVYENTSIPAKLFIVLKNGTMDRCWIEKHGKVVVKNHLIKRPTESDLYYDGWTKIKDYTSDEDYSND